MWSKYYAVMIRIIGPPSLSDVLIWCMPQLLNAPALVNHLMNLTTEEKCKDICVLHMTGARQKADD